MMNNWKDKITDRRKELGITLAELSDRTDISQRTLSRILSPESANYVNLNYIIAIAQALDLGIGELLDGTVGNSSKSDKEDILKFQNETLQKLLAKSEKKQKTLSIVCLALISAIVILFTVDLMIGTQGWFRY